MEWEHITDRWAAMTNRLRGDTTAKPQRPQVLQGARRARQVDEMKPIESSVLDTVDNNSSMLQKQ